MPRRFRALAWRALDALRAAPGRWGTEAVFFYGFDDLHPLERDAIETLARVAGAEVMVSLTYEAGRTALQARAEVVEELRPLAERVIELPALDEHYDPGPRGPAPPRARTVRAAPERIDPGRAIGLLEAGGELAEAELAAAEVLELLRSGVPGEEIAVVYRSPARAAALVEHVFGRYGIAVATDGGRRSRRTALGQAVLAWLDARCSRRQGDAPRTCSSTCALPGLLEDPDGDRPGWKRKSAARACARRPRPARAPASTSPRSRGCASPRTTPPRSCSRMPGGCSPRRTGCGAPVLDADEELDARAFGALARALAELDDLGGEPPLPAPEVIELLETLEVFRRRGCRGRARCF